jgi:hypothetical protein
MSIKVIRIHIMTSQTSVNNGASKTSWGGDMNTAEKCEFLFEVLNNIFV